MKGLGFKGLEGFKAARVEGSGLKGLGFKSVGFEVSMNKKKKQVQQQ